MPVTFYMPDTQVRAVVFLDPENPSHLLVVGREDLGWGEFHNAYGVVATRATGVNLEGTEDSFYLVYVEDCMSPPLAIVREDSYSEAQYRFMEELDWADVDEPDLSDYMEPAGDDAPEPNAKVPHSYLFPKSNGKWASSEAIRLRKVDLLRVEVK